jgi:selenocysteine lyase/cysteine desulfurase
VQPDLRPLFEVDDEVVYLNCPAMSPLLRTVRVAGEQALARRARPWTIRAADWFTEVERLRGLAGGLLGSDSDHVALVPSSSYGMAVAARNLHAGPGQRVVLLAHEFPSSFHTWRAFTERTGAELVPVEREPDQTWTDAVVATIDERTAVVVVPNVHWTNGALVDIPEIARRTRAVAGAALAIDASQSFGMMPLDLDDVRPDFLVSVGYKWQLGPVGISYLYVDERHHGGEPLEENWAVRAGADDFASLVDYHDAYQPGARRFDVGQRPNYGLVPMAVAGLEQLEAWSIAAVGEAVAAITARIADGAAALGLDPLPAGERGPHILGIGLPDGAAARVSAALHEDNVVVSVRGSSLRIGPYLHTHDADVERFLAALAAAV